MAMAGCTSCHEGVNIKSEVQVKSSVESYIIRIIHEGPSRSGADGRGCKPGDRRIPSASPWLREHWQKYDCWLQAIDLRFRLRSGCGGQREVTEVQGSKLD